MIISMLILSMGITISAQNFPKATTKGAVRLFGDKDDLTSVITIIPAGSTVEVVTADSVYTRVLFDGSDGFVLSDRLEPAKQVLNAAPARAAYEPAAGQATTGQAQKPQPQQPVYQQPQEPSYQQPGQPRQTQPQQQAREQEYTASYTERYEILVSKYGADIGKRLYQHKVWKGINSDMARDSWGKPVQINRTYVDRSVDEEWIYSKKYLYFRDGILIDWGPVK